MPESPILTDAILINLPYETAPSKPKVATRDVAAQAREFAWSRLWQA